MVNKMKWLFVSSGAAREITFVVMDSGIPKRAFKSKDMNLAFQYEQNNDFSNFIADFNLESKRRIEALQDGVEIEDKRVIIGITQFKKDMKDIDIKVKTPAREPWTFTKINRMK